MHIHLCMLIFLNFICGTLNQDVVEVAANLGLNKLVEAINETGLYEEWSVDGNDSHIYFTHVIVDIFK